MVQNWLVGAPVQHWENPWGQCSYSLPPAGLVCGFEMEIAPNEGQGKNIESWGNRCKKDL